MVAGERDQAQGQGFSKPSQGSDALTPKCQGKAIEKGAACIKRREQGNFEACWKIPAYRAAVGAERNFTSVSGCRMPGSQSPGRRRGGEAETQSHGRASSNSRRNCLNIGPATEASRASCKLIIPGAERREPHGPPIAGSSASQGTSKTLTCPCLGATGTPQSKCCT